MTPAEDRAAINEIQGAIGPPGLTSLAMLAISDKMDLATALVIVDALVDQSPNAGTWIYERLPDHVRAALDQNEQAPGFGTGLTATHVRFASLASRVSKTDPVAIPMTMVGMLRTIPPYPDATRQARLEAWKTRVIDKMEPLIGSVGQDDFFKYVRQTKDLMQ